MANTIVTNVTLVQHELNKTYAFDTVSFSEWLTDLRKAIFEDTLDKIEKEGHE